MGLPWEELDTFLRLKDGILRPGDGEADIEAMTRIQAETGQEIYRYFDAILDEREQQPRDDILSHFLAAEVDGDRLTREEILDICFLFLIVVSTPSPTPSRASTHSSRNTRRTGGCSPETRR